MIREVMERGGWALVRDYDYVEFGTGPAGPTRQWVRIHEGDRIDAAEFIAGVHLKRIDGGPATRPSDSAQGMTPERIAELRKILCAATHEALDEIERLRKIVDERTHPRGVITVQTPEPIPMHLRCPFCNERHFDEGEEVTRPHKVHACQFCGQHFQPALVPTIGVEFLPGCENKVKYKVTTVERERAQREDGGQ